jgi:ribonuclease J
VPFHTENPAGFREFDVKERDKGIMVFPQDGDMIDVEGGI